MYWKTYVPVAKKEFIANYGKNSIGSQTLSPIRRDYGK